MSSLQTSKGKENFFGLSSELRSKIDELPKDTPQYIISLIKNSLDYAGAGATLGQEFETGAYGNLAFAMRLIFNPHSYQIQTTHLGVLPKK